MVVVAVDTDVMLELADGPTNDLKAIIEFVRGYSKLGCKQGKKGN